jgi:DNA-binding HxlR family transcriptional regulator
LGQRGRRFTELLHDTDGISQRMLTVTLRGLERDGIVSRTVHAVVPPRVDYALTPMGKTLLATVTDLARWADRHARDIEGSRTAYDKRTGADRPRAVS